MKYVEAYRHFKIYEITPNDLKQGIGGYARGDILAFRPDDSYAPQLGYEDWCGGSIQEIHDYIDSDLSIEAAKARANFQAPSDRER